MREEKFHTLHPDGSEGVNILKRRYDLVAYTIVAILREAGGAMRLADLMEEGKKQLEDLLDGEPSWYLTTVKLDLETRGILRCQESEGPRHISLHEVFVR